MIYFISDIHLGFKPKEENKLTENRLLEFFDMISKDAETLVILGDLFDFWFDYRKVIPKNFFRTTTGIYNLIQKNIRVIYIIGNHDFGHYNFFQNDIGVELIQNDLEITFYGKKFYLSHGDGKSYNDTGYKIIKKILRNPLNQKLYRLIHPDIGIWLASGSSRKSRHYTDSKNYGEKDGMLDFAKKKIDEGFDYVIMGHKHKVQFVNYKNGYYINLGEWIINPHYGKFDGNEFQLIKL
ncbi:MAG: UDP-2,3-diacylglucosamine diphosphatase [Candidatus Kapaibacteriota bacterium]